MKKLFTTIILICYFFASSGTTIHVPYCGGKAVEWDLGKSTSDEKCPGCGMTEKDKKDCCHDKETTIKIYDNYQHSISDVQIAPTLVSCNHFAKYEDFKISYFSLQREYCSLKKPFRKIHVIYISNCTFLI